MLINLFVCVNQLVGSFAFVDDTNIYIIFELITKNLKNLSK